MKYLDFVAEKIKSLNFSAFRKYNRSISKQLKGFNDKTAGFIMGYFLKRSYIKFLFLSKTYFLLYFIFKIKFKKATFTEN